MKNYFVLLLSVVMIASSCKNESEIPEDFDYGKVENNVYHNDFFKLKMKIPKGWTVLDQKETNELIDEYANDYDSDFQKSIDASKISTAYLLTIFEHPPEEAVMFNPSILMMAENITGKRIVSEADYIRDMKKVFKLTGKDIEIVSKDSEKKSINGESFSVVRVKMVTYGIDVYQKYYIKIINDFALAITLSYVYDDQLSVLEEHVHTLKFED